MNGGHRIGLAFIELSMNARTGVNKTGKRNETSSDLLFLLQ